MLPNANRCKKNAKKWRRRKCRRRTENEIALVRPLVEKFDLAVFGRGILEKKNYCTCNADPWLVPFLSLSSAFAFFVVPMCFPWYFSLSLRTCELFTAPFLSLLSDFS